MNILYFILWFIEVFQSSLIVTKIPKWKMLINYCLGKKHLLPIKFSSCPKTTGPICHSFFLLAWGLGCEPGHQQSPINGTRVFAHSLSLSPATVLCHVICNDQSQASIQVTWPTVLCPESPEFSHGHILSWSAGGSESMSTLSTTNTGERVAHGKLFPAVWPGRAIGLWWLVLWFYICTSTMRASDQLYIV